MRAGELVELLDGVDDAAVVAECGTPVVDVAECWADDEHGPLVLLVTGPGPALTAGDLAARLGDLPGRRQVLLDAGSGVLAYEVTATPGSVTLHLET